MLLITVLTAAISCKKFVDVSPPTTEILASNAFLTDNSATSAVLGIYTNMQSDNDFLNDGITLYSGIYSDDLILYLQNPSLIPFQQSQVPPTNSTLNSMWSNAYKNIAYINTCIAGIKASTSLTPTVKAQLLGESEFCRAFTYFYLVNFWENIPLVTITDYGINAAIAQSKSADIYKLILADLTDAQLQLTTTYPTSGKVRPNKWTATALLARVYLYTKDYVNAESQSSAVITSGSYGTALPALNNAFLVGSTEAIWQLLPTGTFSGTQEGANFLSDIPYGSADYYVTTDLLNSFETGDNRKTSWISSVVNSGKTYFYPYKYKLLGSYGGTSITENYVMLRLSEQYLIRAEARAQQNKLAGTGSAAEDLNIIRTRAGLPNTTANTQSALLLAVDNENRHEFFAEWGHRWLDLKRNGKADAVLSAAKPTTWKSTSVLLPLPQNELNLDKNLIQNPGY